MLKWVPSIVSTLRLLALPFLIFSVDHGLVVAGYLLFLFAIGTDILDGYLAKKWKVSTTFGAQWDATVDFVFIISMFFLFSSKGFYPAYLLALMAFTYSQFMLTSLLSKFVYDPVGKYYGSILYGAIGLTLLSQVQPLFDIVTMGTVVATTASLLSRLCYFLRAKKGIAKKGHGD